VLCGGEALPAELARTLIDGSAQVWNVYGPTETTVWSAACPLGPERPEPLLGEPIANTTLYVLDAQLGHVPLGTPGELYIGGAGLARGYLRRPALSAERFVPNPFGEPGTRLYRTGDRVRVRADGAIEFLGRADHQLKLRGYRIEPGEIEARLLEHPRVRRAVVAAVGVGAGDKRLVAYLERVPVGEAEGEGDAALVSELRAALERALPEYMRPQHYLLLEQFPLTPNGKLDRKRLPALDASAGRAYAAPETSLQRRLAVLWGEVLGVERVGLHDNFFELGGHSLLATRLVARIREELATDVPLRALFEAVTVAELAAILEQRSARALSAETLDEMAALLDQLEAVR
jgi:acyl-coenzyme A synthetase/AMP-(fatty) acid ligase